ncbi:MAG: HEAT repeat domain-containing protein [Pseudomarimonas sp.]
MPRLFARLSLSMSLLLSLSHAVAAPLLQAQLDALPQGDWLEYRVALQPGQRAPCCFEWQNEQIGKRGCRLQDKPGSYGTSDDQPMAAAGASLRVLLQRGEHGLSRVLAVGEQCPVDAGSAKVRDIGEVDTKASVEWLAQRVEGDGRRQRSEALHALALHAGTAADVALERMAATGRKQVRDDAVFWLAQARGERGFREVRRLLEDATGSSAGRLVFALSISPVAEAPAALRTLATDHSHASTRSEALFWLAQKPDPQAEAILRQAMRNDPDEDVRRKAVFATSQLPAERAIPILRALVEEKSESRELRKEALFWLAQIDDADVVSVFDDLLGLGAR